MQDISMCNGEGCMLRATCYRNRATPSNYQSWARFEDICNELNNYPNYIPIESRECANVYKQVYGCLSNESGKEKC